MTRARWIVLAVLVLLVAGAVAFVLSRAGSDDAPDERMAGAGESIQPALGDDGTYTAGSLVGEDATPVAAAADAVPVVLSYDYESLDAGLAAATAKMTPTFAEEFRATFDASTRPLAEQKRAVTEARVRAAGLVSASGDTATVLVFVDQVLVSSRALEAKGSPVRVGQTRVLVELERAGESWKVSALRPV